MRYFNLLLLVIIPCFLSAQVYVNEYQSLNNSSLVDAEGDYSDWIELYNSSASPLDISGYYLSDDASDLTKYEIASLTLPANGYVIIFCSGKDVLIGQEIHTSFKLSSAGEEVLLVMPDGVSIISQLPAQALLADQSFGRTPDGSANLQVFSTPSPGSANTAANVQLMSPSFSVEGGLYTSSFSLDLLPSDPNDTIYYTLDGSEPSRASMMYSGSITIEDKTSSPNRLSMIDPTIPDSYLGLNWWDFPNGQVFKGMVVRAKSFNGVATPSKTETHTYLIDADIMNKYDSVLVMSLVTDSVNLFSDSSGIYVPGDLFDSVSYLSCNYSQRGDAWERPAHIEFFDPDSNMKRVVAQDIGVRVSGNYTRAMNVKSLRLHARSEYGESRVDYDFFPDFPVKEHKRLTMRTGGNDAWNTIYRDLFVVECAKDVAGPELIYGKQGVLFIDGEFWGIYNLRSRLDKFYFEDTHGISADNGELDLLDITDQATAEEGTWDHFNQLDNFVASNDMTDAANYDILKTYMDPEQFADVIIYEIFIANEDWPQNNNKMWRKRVAYDSTANYAHDGRLRWIMYDFDLAVGKSQPATYNMISKIFDNNGFSTELIRYLVGEYRASGQSLPGNEEFRNYFLTRFADLLNSDLLTSRMLDISDSLAANIVSNTQENGRRNRRQPSQYWWNFEVEKMNTFIQDRPAYQYQHLMDRFPLGDTSWVHLDVNDEAMGRVRVNTLTIDKRLNGWEDQPYPFSGKYFDSLITTIEALPRPGYVFVEWVETGVTQPLLQFKTNGDTTLTALFAPDQDYLTIQSAWDLSVGPYKLNEWSPSQAAGTYPPNMMFVQSRFIDPDLSTPLEDPYTMPYNMDRRTRVLGLDTSGFAFYNTGSQYNKLDPDFEGRDLGGARLAINTLGQDSVYVGWTTGTIDDKDKRYAVSLLARIGESNPYVAVTDTNGNPVVYISEEVDTTMVRMPEVMLPDSMHNKPYVELLWKFHIDSGIVGSRSAIYIDDIYVGPSTDTIDTNDTFVPEAVAEMSNMRVWPNPSYGDAQLSIKLDEPYRGMLQVTDLNGRLVAAEEVRLRTGENELSLRRIESALPAGVYLIRLENQDQALRWLKQ